MSDLGCVLKHCWASWPGLPKVPPTREPSQDLPTPPSPPPPPLQCVWGGTSQILEQWVGEGAGASGAGKGPDLDHRQRDSSLPT